MALHRLLGMEIGVPQPQVLDDFYREIGLSGGNGSWGSAEQPGQIAIAEAPYRQLLKLHVGCQSEEDLANTGTALEALGIQYQTSGNRLQCSDPINRWEVIVEPAPAFDIPAQPERVQNRPGHRARIGKRAELVTEAAPRPPRRLGHVVIGTPDPLGTVPIYQALGFRISDVVAGLATFMRCSPDHHNFLVAPGRVPYLNHYALEHDDFDSLARAATIFLREHGDDRQIAGPGRHMVGGNQFWYLLDPSGSFFEFFSDMDRIDDDDAWEIRTDWDLADSWSLWGEKDQPEVFFNPPDMEEVAAGWEKQHG